MHEILIVLLLVLWVVVRINQFLNKCWAKSDQKASHLLQNLRPAISIFQHLGKGGIDK